MLKYLLCIALSLNLSYASCTVSKERPPLYNRTLDTIGDSLTWGLSGHKMRCMLAYQGLKYDFVGNYIDIYGYRHDGHGGDNTDNVLERISTIPKSDIYLLWIGVNDTKTTPEYTFNNILKIANILYQKNPYAIIYISTLLPTINYNNDHNDSVNCMLRNGLPCTNCVLIDLGKYFSSLKNWKSLLPDGVHPNDTGYYIITNYIATIIKQAKIGSDYAYNQT